MKEHFVSPTGSSTARHNVLDLVVEVVEVAVQKHAHRVLGPGIGNRRLVNAVVTRQTHLRCVTL